MRVLETELEVNEKKSAVLDKVNYFLDKAHDKYIDKDTDNCKTA